MISAFNEVLSSLENKKVIEALEEAHRIERVRQHKARRRKLIIERWQSEFRHIPATEIDSDTP